MKYKNAICQMLFAALSFYLIYLMLRYPALALDYASTGLDLWFKRMIPTLLPFMILSGIMIRMNLTETCVGFLHPLLHCIYGTSRNGSYAIVMGFLCGFPMGARIVGELYASGKLSREESARLLSFCNNIGPIYFLSYVVPTLAIDKPVLPFVIMYGLPLFYGFILMRVVPSLRRTYGRAGAFSPAAIPIPGKEKPSLLAAVDASVLSGLTGIAKLGGYMVFFNLLNILFVPFSNTDSVLLQVYRCLLEITSGIDASGQSLYYAILILLPFGGFSCIAQTYSMIQHTDLSIRAYLFHKILQTALTAFCYLVLL